MPRVSGLMISLFSVSFFRRLIRGRPPYPEVNNWDMALFLKQGHRLPQPDSCPPFLFKIMLQCWDEDPNKRPTFTELVQTIESETQQLEARSAARKIGLQVTYVNVSRGNYYNPSHDGEDRSFGASMRMSGAQESTGDASSAGDSGFASTSFNRSLVPRNPAPSPRLEVPVDDSGPLQKAIL